MKFDNKWEMYVSDAPEGAVEALYATLEILVDKTRDAQVDQPPAFDRVNSLLEASERHNDAVHAYIGKIMAECGAEYHPGPIKLGERILAKADNDYGT